MSKEITEINQLNDKIQRNVAAKERADRAQREAARQERITKAIDACRIPVMAAAAAIIAATMGLATANLATIVSIPVLLYVCYQAGTVR